MAHKHSPIRIIVASLTLLPAIIFIGLQLIVNPDLETWLEDQTKGLARPDAFDGVAKISPLFAAVFGVTSLFAAFLVVSRRSQYLIPLSAGPLLTAFVYLAAYGVTDPHWWSLLALLGLGMLVASPVTATWVAFSWTPHKTEGSTGAAIGCETRD